MQDEELVKQRELLMAVLKQNEELANTIKALQEHMNLNTDTNKVNGSHQISINVDSKNQKGRDGSNTNAGPSNPRVTFHSHVNPEPEYQGVTKKEIQAMIAQQMQITRGGYALPPVQNCGHPYPVIYDLEEYPKGYVIPKFRIFSGEGSRDLNPEQYLAHFVASCENTGENDALLL
jgi:organic hydroperoxide reductase OsmC/OhrA